MRQGRILFAFALLSAVASAALLQQSCGDDNVVPVLFRGNVTGVTPVPTSSLPVGEKTEVRKSFLARLRALGRGREIVSSAVAQSGGCSTATQAELADMLICVQLEVTPIATATLPPTPGPSPTGTPPTPTPEPAPATSTPTGSPPATATITPTPVTNCIGIDSATCVFQTVTRLGHDHDPVSILFVEDRNGDGILDPQDRKAPLSEVQDDPRFCNGDVVELPDVTVDFTQADVTGEGTATLGPAGLSKEVDACGFTPTPGATGTPGAGGTETPGTPGPTATQGTPGAETPTPEATATETPSCLNLGADCSAVGASCCTPGQCVPGGQPGSTCIAPPAN